MATERPMIASLELIDRLRWIDGSSLGDHVEPYRRRIFEASDQRDETGRLRYNLLLTLRAKKNWKSGDLCLKALTALISDSPHGSQVYLVANDEDQAGDDLSLVKKLIDANPALKKLLIVRDKIIHRRDSRGFLKIIPAQHAAGEHGRTYRFLGIDEIHGYRNWDLLEALQPDPTRLDSQIWIASYNSIFHKPGIPLYDLIQIGKAGTDPRMLFSYYAADWTTDPEFIDCTPEQRANPSMQAWADQNYIEQQRRRLPAHKFRRLHLNLPGLPEGSAYQPEPIMEAIARTVTVRHPEPGTHYLAFTDMSGGSNDDAVLAIAHRDQEGRIVLDTLLNQGPPPPFDPRAAVERFVAVLKEYGCQRVHGDKYAGETFIADFQRHGIAYEVCGMSKSELYEAFEPVLNAREVSLLNAGLLEQQLLGLIWRGSKIDHPPNDHDDWANAAAGACVLAGPKEPVDLIFIGGGFISANSEEDQKLQEQLAQERAAEGARLIEEACLVTGVWFPGE